MRRVNESCSLRISHFRVLNVRGKKESLLRSICITAKDDPEGKERRRARERRNPLC